MDKIKKNFGFGCLRLPMKDGEVDKEQMCKMVDTFLEQGFNYFDTAHGYLDGKSELALRDCLTSRHERSEYILTNKLTNFYFKSEEEIRPFFESQMKACGVDYFDFYLMHAQSEEIFKYFKKCHAYEIALQLKEEGKIRHFGISFHDKAEALDQILTEYPQIEVVQIQFNYLDYENPAVQSRKCYEVCRKHNKPVLIMEPVKGGNLVNLPEDAKKVLDDLHGGSPASYALRFAAGFEGVLMVLSGMSNMEQMELMLSSICSILLIPESNMEQMEDNISFMKDFQPLNEKEMEAVHKVADIFHQKHAIACTACRYCTAGCPKQISIPDLFACMNAKKVFNDCNANYYYSNAYTVHNGKASDCIKCGKCEKACPQHLPIRDLLEDVAKEFETEQK